MYLSQLMVDGLQRKTMKLLADIYLLHQFVMSGFSKHEQPGRILYRVEPEVRGGIMLHIPILIQSQVKPEWDRVSEKQIALKSAQVKEFELELKKGGGYQFRLRANPVVTRNGKRFGLVRDEALVCWLREKEKNIGAVFQDILPIDEGYLNGNRRKGKCSDIVCIKTARYEGMLQVENPTRFKESVTNGIGPAKAFGCGLISLKRC